LAEGTWRLFGWSEAFDGGATVRWYEYASDDDWRGEVSRTETAQ
jgi:hypothetical protein